MSPLRDPKQGSQRRRQEQLPLKLTRQLWLHREDVCVDGLVSDVEDREEMPSSFAEKLVVPICFRPLPFRPRAISHMGIVVALVHRKDRLRCIDDRNTAPP